MDDLGNMNDHDLRSIASEALVDFWERVAKRIPQVTSGDLTPEQVMALDKAAFDAVKAWYNNNVRETR